jgi:hypothetical protein
MIVDRDTVNSRWRAIEARLTQIAAGPGLDRQVCLVEVEQLLSEQDAIEFVLGVDRSAMPGGGARQAQPDFGLQ